MDYTLALLMWLMGLGPNPDMPPSVPPYTEDGGGMTTQGGGIPTRPPEIRT